MSTPGLVLFAAAMGVGEPGFSGSGVLVQIEFRILQKFGQSDLSFEGIPYDTFLVGPLNSSGMYPDIPFVPSNGHYALEPFGDVNFDGTVDMKDVGVAILAFNSFRGTSRWNPYADLDNSGHVDMRDIVLIVLDFGKHV